MRKYSVSKSYNGDYYVLWLDTNIGNGYCCRGIFKGTRKECYEKKKEVMKNEK